MDLPPGVRAGSARGRGSTSRRPFPAVRAGVRRRPRMTVPSACRGHAAGRGREGGDPARRWPAATTRPAPPRSSGSAPRRCTRSSTATGCATTGAATVRSRSRETRGEARLGTAADPVPSSRWRPSWSSSPDCSELADTRAPGGRRGHRRERAHHPDAADAGRAARLRIDRTTRCRRSSRPARSTLVLKAATIPGPLRRLRGDLRFRRHRRRSHQSRPGRPRPGGPRTAAVAAKPQPRAVAPPPGQPASVSPVLRESTPMRLGGRPFASIHVGIAGGLLRQRVERGLPPPARRGGASDPAGRGGRAPS